MPDHRLAVPERDRLVLWDLSKNTTQIIPVPKSPLKKVYEIHRLLKIDAKRQPYFNHEGRILRLNQRDTHKGLQKTLTTEDGLPNNTIYCILPDKAGKLWCSTNKGIFRFDPKNLKVELTFEKADGLSDNEFNRALKFVYP